MTPVRLALIVLVVGAAAVVIYALFVDSSQIKLPLIVSGLAVAAICLSVLGFSLAGSAARLGEAGRGGWALLIAFGAGLLVLGAAGSAAAAIVLGILAWSG